MIMIKDPRIFKFSINLILIEFENIIKMNFTFK